MTTRPLDGMRVVEWCSLVCGPFCGKWLAEAGADVIKIEAPGEGDEARRRGPFPDDQPDPERSGLSCCSTPTSAASPSTRRPPMAWRSCAT